VRCEWRTWLCWHSSFKRYLPQIPGTLWSVHLIIYHSGDQIKVNEMGGAHGTYTRQESCVRGFVGRLRGRDHLEVLGVCASVVVKQVFKKWDGEAWTGLIWLE
jgi:hypothetical protein